MPMYQVVFGPALVADIAYMAGSYDRTSLEKMLSDIEKTCIKNIEHRTVIKLGMTQLILCTMDDIIQAKDGDD